MTRLRAVLNALSPTTLDQKVREFFQDEHIRQIFDRYATYNGSSPYRVASVYSIIPYVELAWGGWYIRGGIYTLAQALGKLAGELGVCIETNCVVRRILVERGSARGVVLANGGVLRGDVVIANSDVVTTQRELLSPAAQNDRQVKRLEQLEPSCSGFVLMLGVDQQYPQLSHHNIFFSNNYRSEFDDLFVRTSRSAIPRSTFVRRHAVTRPKLQRAVKTSSYWSTRHILLQVAIGNAMLGHIEIGYWTCWQAMHRQGYTIYANISSARKC